MQGLCYIRPRACRGIEMINTILKYLNRNEQFASEEKGVITIFRGYSPGVTICPVVNKYWKVGQDNFPYPTVRIYEPWIPKTTTPLDIWQLREDHSLALVIPDSTLYTLKLNPDTGIYDVPTEGLTIIDLTSEEELEHDWSREKTKKPRKVRRISK